MLEDSQNKDLIDNELDDSLSATTNSSEELELDDDIQMEDDNNVLRNTVITVGKDKYAAGLFWQPLQDPEDSLTEIEETAETIFEGADLYCIRSSTTPQYGLGISGDIKPGMKVASSAVADAFSDKPSSVAVFKVEEGWWFIVLRSDLILAEDDRLFTSEDDAKKAFMKMMAVPDWGRKIAPTEWGISGTSYIELEDILRRSSSLRLVKIGSGNNVRNLWIFIALLLVLLVAGYKLIEMLSPPTIEYKPIPKIEKKVVAPVVQEELPPPPWLTLKDPADILNKCYKGIMEHNTVNIPGWEKGQISCKINNKNGNLLANWSRNDGRIEWFVSALKRMNLEGYFKNTISDNGSNGSITSSFKDINIINSPPEYSGKDLRLEFLDIFDAVSIRINFSQTTEGTIKDPNNPNSPGRPRFFLVKFKFSSEYSPDMWVDVLPQFPALTIENIMYNFKNKTWSYEGKIYERRN